MTVLYEDIEFDGIPIESERLDDIEISFGERTLAATIFRTPDELIAVLIILPADCSLQTFASVQPNTRIRERAFEVVGRAPDFYQVRYLVDGEGELLNHADGGE